MSTSRQRRSTSGTSVSRRSSPASSIRAPDGNSAIRTSPLGRRRTPSTAACARASAVNTSSAWATSAWPAGVSRSPRPAGSVSGTPTSAASARSCWEIADGVNDSAAATAVTDPRSASSRSTRNRATSMKPSYRDSADLFAGLPDAGDPRWRHVVPGPPARRSRRRAVGRQLPRHPHRPAALPAAVPRWAAVRGDRAAHRALCPRPQVRLRWLLGYGLGFGTLQFLFLFVAMDVGMPTGLASLVLQASAPFTVLLGALFLRERLSARQAAGIGLAVLGLAAI